MIGEKKLYLKELYIILRYFSCIVHNKIRCLVDKNVKHSLQIKKILVDQQAFSHNDIVFFVFLANKAKEKVISYSPLS